MGYGAGIQPGYGAGRGVGFGAGAQGRFGAGPASGFGAGYEAAWSPLSLGSSLAAWYKGDGMFWQDSARTTAAVADGDPIGSWDDASGNGRHATQATSGKRFTLKTGGNGQNGLPIALADGVDDFLATASQSLAQPFTVYLAMKMETVGGASANDIILHLGGAGAEVAVLSTDTTPQTVLYTNPSITYAGNVASSAFGVVTAKFAGVSSAIREDGVSRASGDAGANGGTGAFVFGALDGGARPVNAKFAEIIITNSADSAATMAQVESYLRAKWGTP